MTHHRTFPALLAACAVLLRLASAAVIINGNDESANAATSDVFLHSGNTGGIHGHLDYLAVSGIERSLIHFDLSQLAGNLADAELTLTVKNRDPGLPNGTTFNIYQVDPANAGWDENAVSWDNFNQYLTTPWVGGGGLGNPGDGYAATPMGSFLYGGETAGSTISLALDTAVVQSWIDSPAENAGILVHSPGLSNWITFETTESTSGEPVLNLTGAVAVIPEPSLLGLLLLGAVVVLPSRRLRKGK